MKYVSIKILKIIMVEFVELGRRFHEIGVGSVP